MKKISLKGAKLKAWRAFSIYIRTKYSEDGICTCFTCDKELPIKEMQCGHGIGGRTNAILFCEEAVRPQCYSCNCGYSKGKYEIFVPKLIELYGLDGYNELVKLKRTTVKYTVPDFLDIEKEYKQALEDL